MQDPLTDGVADNPAGDLRRNPRGGMVLVGLVAAEVAALAHFTWSGFFVYDDYTLLRQAQRYGLSHRLLLSPLNIHFSPGRAVLDWLLVRVAPLDWGVSQVLLLACFAATALVLHRLLVELFGGGPGPLLLVVVYGTSIVLVGTLQWWAAGALSLPCALFSLLCMLGYVRFHRSGDRRLLALSVLALVGALLFYLKGLLVPLYLVLLRVLVLEPDQRVRDSLAAVARDWRTWCAYLAPCALYAAAYLAWYPALPGWPRLGDLAEVVRLAWLRAFIPNVVGLQVPVRDPSAADQVGVVVVQLVVVGAVVWSVVRDRRAWRAWLLLAVGFLANATVVGVERLGFGPAIAFAHRYWVESTYLLVIAAGAAFMGFGRRDRPATRWSWAEATRRRGRALVAAALTVHLVAASAGAAGAVEAWPGQAARRYMDRVKAGLDRLGRAGIEPTIVDGPIPDVIMPSWVAYGEEVPYNRFSQVFALLEPRLAFNRPSRHLYTVTNAGSLVPTIFVPQAGGSAAGLWRTGALGLVLGVGAAQPDGAGVCVRSGDRASSVELTPPAPITGQRLYAALYYRSDRPGTVTLFSDDGSGYQLLRQSPTVASEAGAHAALLPLGGARSTRVRLDLPARSRTCLDRLELGTLFLGAHPAAPPGTAVRAALDPFTGDGPDAALGSTPGGIEWHTENGAWRVSGGQAHLAAPPEGPGLAVLGPAPADVDVAVRLAAVATRAGLVFRYRDPRNYWAVEAVPALGGWAVVHVVDGNESAVAAAGPATTRAGTTVGVRLRGDRAAIVVDGREVTAVSSPPTEGADGVGMIAEGPQAPDARFTDFTVTAPGG